MLRFLDLCPAVRWHAYALAGYDEERVQVLSPTECLVLNRVYTPSHAGGDAGGAPEGALE